MVSGPDKLSMSVIHSSPAPVLRVALVNTHVSDRKITETITPRLLGPNSSEKWQEDRVCLHSWHTSIYKVYKQHLSYTFSLNVNNSRFICISMELTLWRAYHLSDIAWTTKTVPFHPKCPQFLIELHWITFYTTRPGALDHKPSHYIWYWNWQKSIASTL